MLKSILIATALFFVATAASAQYGFGTQGYYQQRMRALNAEMEANQLRMQLQEYEMREAGERLKHACDPDVLQRPGVHLLARMGLCGERRVEAPAQERVAAQPRKLPSMKNGPTSVYDRPSPYYRGQ
jgi:hypothetical protein